MLTGLPCPVQRSRARFVDALNSVLGYEWFASEIRGVIADISADTKGHYVAFSLDDPPRISYASKPGSKLDSDNRGKLTLMRYLKRQYKAELASVADCHVEHFCNYVAELLMPWDEGFDIITGKEIREAYLKGPRSCMSGECCKYVDIYCQNPDTVSLIRVTKSDNIVGRCLLWENKYTDKLYCSDALSRMRFYRYIERVGFKDIPAEYSVVVNDSSNGLYPYLDTMRYARRVSASCIELFADYAKGTITLDSTSGGWGSDEERFDCHCCGDGYVEDDGHYVDGEFICEHCLRDHYYWIEYLCEYVHEDDCTTDVNSETIRSCDADCYCDGCSKAARLDVDSMTSVRNLNGDESLFCEECLGDCDYVACPCCDELILLG